MQHTSTNFNKLFYLNIQPMWIFDPQTLRFLEVNDAAVWNYGYSRADFMAMTVLDIRPKEDQLKFVTLLQDLCGDKFFADPVRHVLKDGSIRHVQISCYCIEREDKPVYLVAPLEASGKDTFTLRLHQLINKLEFTLLQKIDSERKRMTDLRSLAGQLEMGISTAKQIAVIARIKILLNEIPESGLN